jgi:hypothetical protein
MQIGTRIFGMTVAAEQGGSGHHPALPLYCLL